VHGNYTVDLARDKAKKWCADIAQDIDPKEQKKAKTIEQKKSILFTEFWKIFTDKYIREHHKPSTIQGNKSRIKNKILPFFGAKKLADIERQDILAFKDSFSHVRGNCTKCLALLSPAFEQAELWGYRDRNSNPCKGVAKSPSRKMERFLSNGELETLERVLTDYATAGNASHYTVAAFRLLIYTGCRLGEVLTLKWEEVDLQNNCLRLKDSKTGARVIPLNDSAREVVLSIEKKGDNPYVFCGNKPETHLVAVQKTWGRIRKKAGMPDLRIHDLRHSFASFAINNADLDLVHVQKLLGHKNIATTLRYAHLTDKKLLDSTNRIFKTQKEGTLNAA
jgi:integrase